MHVCMWQAVHVFLHVQEGKTPLDVAKKKKQVIAVVKYLEEQGIIANTILNDCYTIILYWLTKFTVKRP